MRLLAALYPQLAVWTVGDEYTDEALPGDWTCDETATHRRRLLEFYLEALVDDDGRVRHAAVKALKELAVTADLIDATDELQTMRTDVETVANECDDEAVQMHLDQAAEYIAFHTTNPGSLLPEGLRDAFE